MQKRDDVDYKRDYVEKRCTVEAGEDASGWEELLGMVYVPDLLWFSDDVKEKAELGFLVGFRRL